MKNPHDIIQTVLITEKGSVLKEEQNKYLFKIHPDATKVDVTNAVEKLFEVKVKSVNIMNCRGKMKRAGRSMKPGRRPNWKKAIVSLSKGTIEIM